jgi:hexosaminidase
MPGHAQAVIAAYPELGLSEEPLEVSRRWGGHPALFNLEESTLQFLFDVLDEVIEVFPSPHIHIGGDEAASAEWEKSESSLKRMEELGLKNAKEAHTWFIGRIAGFLRSRQRKLVGWDEITEPGLPSETTILSWRGAAQGYKAVELGYHAVMCPYHSTYFDYYQSAETGEEPLGNRDIDVPYIDLQMVYAFEPIPPMLNPKQRAQVTGVQGQLWTEYIPSERQLEYMAFPRACALSEVAWSAVHRRDFQDFRLRLERHLKRLNCQVVHYRPLF